MPKVVPRHFPPSFSIVHKSEQKGARSGVMPAVFVQTLSTLRFGEKGSILVFLGSSGKAHFVNVNKLSFALARNSSVLNGIGEL